MSLVSVTDTRARQTAPLGRSRPRQPHLLHHFTPGLSSFGFLLHFNGQTDASFTWLRCDGAEHTCSSNQSACSITRVRSDDRSGAKEVRLRVIKGCAVPAQSSLTHIHTETFKLFTQGLNFESPQRGSDGICVDVKSLQGQGDPGGGSKCGRMPRTR